MISVIIPTYKTPSALDLCLRSILNGQKKENQIIVVVDGFLDINSSVIDKYKDKVNVIVLEKNVGTCKATNIGVYHANCENIFIANDDNVFPKNWDEHLENNFQTDSVLTVNSIEPYPSIFPQIHIKNLGRNPELFDLESFWQYLNRFLNQ